MGMERVDTVMEPPQYPAQYPAQYPVQFSIDYPDRPLDRVTTAFRIFAIIPIAVVLETISGGGTWQSSYGHSTSTVVAGAGGLLFLGPLLMILFRRKYPRWWFDFVQGVIRWNNRVIAYAATLVTDQYPPFRLAP
jgi:hypothetical protein